MQIYDLLALISYPGIVINVFLLSLRFSASFVVQFKARIILWVTALVFIAILTLGTGFGLQFYSRLLYVINDTTNPSPISAPLSVVWFVLFIALTSINILYATRNDQKYIPIGKRKDWD